MSGILRLESLTKGNTLKQGDKTPLKYRLFDADGENLNIAGKSAKVRLVYPDFLTIGYEKDGLTVAHDDTVTFTIDGVIPSRIYHVEIIVDDQFIFPSRADEAKFTVDKSSLGTESNIIEIIGVDAVVRKAVDLINSDPNLIVDEDRIVNDIISSTGIGSLEEYNQQFNDVIADVQTNIENKLIAKDEEYAPRLTSVEDKGDNLLLSKVKEISDVEQTANQQILKALIPNTENRINAQFQNPQFLALSKDVASGANADLLLKGETVNEKSVSGAFRLKSIGRNLFDKKKRNFNYGYIEPTNGVLKVDNRYVHMFFDAIDAEMVFNRIPEHQFGGATIVYFDEAMGHLGATNGYEPFNPPPNCKTFSLHIRRVDLAPITNDGISFIRDSLQLQLGKTSTSYEPYKEHIQDIKVVDENGKVMTLMSDGNVQDELRVNRDGQYEMVEKIKRNLFDKSISSFEYGYYNTDNGSATVDQRYIRIKKSAPIRTEAKQIKSNIDSFLGTYIFPVNGLIFFDKNDEFISVANPNQPFTPPANYDYFTLHLRRSDLANMTTEDIKYISNNLKLELVNDVIRPAETIGTLPIYPHGIVLYEPFYTGVDYYGTGVNVDELKFSSIEKVIKINPFTKSEVDITSSCTLNTLKNGFTSTALSENDICRYELKVDQETTANGTKYLSYNDDVSYKLFENIINEHEENKRKEPFFNNRNSETIESCQDSAEWTVEGGTLETVQKVDDTLLPVGYVTATGTLPKWGFNALKYSITSGTGVIHKPINTYFAKRDEFITSLFIDRIFEGNVTLLAWKTFGIKVRLYSNYPNTTTDYFESPNFEMFNTGEWTLSSSTSRVNTYSKVGNPDWGDINGIGFVFTADENPLRVYLGGAYKLSPRNSKGAVFFEFDDGNQSIYNVAYPYFLEKGIAGNAAICGAGVDAGKVISPTTNIPTATVEELLRMQEAGWDINNHTLNHPNLSSLSYEDQEYQIRENKKWLNDRGLHAPAFVPPGHGRKHFTSELIAKYHKIGRGRGNTNKYQTLPLNFDPVLMGSVPMSGNYAIAQLKMDLMKAQEQKLFLGLQFHSIGEGGWDDMTVEKFKEIVDTVMEFDLQVLTYSDVLNGNWV